MADRGGVGRGGPVAVLADVRAALRWVGGGVPGGGRRQAHLKARLVSGFQQRALPSRQRRGKVEQVLGGEHQFQPDLVGRELTEGDAAQSGVLAAADAVLDAGMATMAGLELGQVVLVLVGDSDLETEALVIGEGELSARVRTFASADGPGPFGPRRQVEVGQLADARSLALVAGLGDVWHPSALGHG